MNSYIEIVRGLYEAGLAEIGTWSFLGWLGFTASVLAISQFLYVSIRAVLRWMDSLLILWVVKGSHMQLRLMRSLLKSVAEDVELSCYLRSDSSLMVAYIGERFARRAATIAAGIVCIITLPSPFDVLSGGFLIATASMSLWALHNFLSLQRNLEKGVNTEISKVRKMLNRLDSLFLNKPPPYVKAATDEIDLAIEKVQGIVKGLEEGAFKPLKNMIAEQALIEKGSPVPPIDRQ